MEIEWRFGTQERRSQVDPKGPRGCKGRLFGVAEVAKGSPKGWREQVRRAGHEARAHEVDGVRWARRWSGLARGSMRSQSKRTVKTIPRR